MQEDRLSLEELPFRSSYSKDGIDGLKNSIAPYYSIFQSIHTLAISVFGKALKIFKAGPCRSSKMRYWQQLQYYNSPLPTHFYSISEICPNYEADHRYAHQLFLVWVRKGGASWLTLEFLVTYPHCHLFHKFYSNTDRNLCYYCASLMIETVSLLLLGNQDGNSICQGRASTMDPHNCLVKSHTWPVTSIFLNCVPHRISIERQVEILTFSELFFLSRLQSYRKSFIHIARWMQQISVRYGRWKLWELRFSSLFFQSLACYYWNEYLNEMQRSSRHAENQYLAFHYSMGALLDWRAMNF